VNDARGGGGGGGGPVGGRGGGGGGGGGGSGRAGKRGDGGNEATRAKEKSTAASTPTTAARPRIAEEEAATTEDDDGNGGGGSGDEGGGEGNGRLLAPPVDPPRCGRRGPWGWEVAATAGRSDGGEVEGARATAHAVASDERLPLYAPSPLPPSPLPPRDKEEVCGGKAYFLASWQRFVQDHWTREPAHFKKFKNRKNPGEVQAWLAGYAFRSR